jgi:hypothetical protein
LLSRDPVPLKYLSIELYFVGLSRYELQPFTYNKPFVTELDFSEEKVSIQVVNSGVKAVRNDLQNK